MFKKHPDGANINRLASLVPQIEIVLHKKKGDPKNGTPEYKEARSEDGTPIRRNDSSHLGFVFDPVAKRLLVIATVAMDDRRL